VKVPISIVSLILLAFLMKVPVAGQEHSFMPHRFALVTGYGFLSGAINEEGQKRPYLVPVFGLD